MKMSKLEKIIVNSKRHARTNLKAFADAKAALDLSAIRNALEVGCGAGDLAAHLSIC